MQLWAEEKSRNSRPWQVPNHPDLNLDLLIEHSALRVFEQVMKQSLSRCMAISGSSFQIFMVITRWETTARAIDREPEQT